MSMDNVSVVLNMGVQTMIPLQKARGSEKQQSRMERLASDDLTMKGQDMKIVFIDLNTNNDNAPPQEQEAS